MGWEHCEGDDWILGEQEEEKVPIAVVNVAVSQHDTLWFWNSLIQDLIRS